MKGMKRKIGLAFAVFAGTLIGAFRGEVAKQRYVSKVKNRYEQHDKIQRSDEVILDEFELSAFHTT